MYWAVNLGRQRLGNGKTSIFGEMNLLFMKLNSAWEKGTREKDMRLTWGKCVSHTLAFI